MNQPASLSRCLTVVAVASGLLAGLAAFLLPDLRTTAALLRTGSGADPAFPELLVRGCALAALLAAAWLWALTCLVAAGAARGRNTAASRAVPAAVRRLVLVACGVALAGTATVPAGADPGAPGAIAGLPLPDRPTGAASASAPVAASAAAAARAGTASVLRSAAGRAPRVVVVRAGDTLWDLAARQLPPGAGPAEINACWRRIHELNRQVIGDDPDLIRPGQRLRLPRR